MDDLLVDVGLEPAEVEALVQPGDLITLDVPMLELQNGRLAAKAMDDRASVAAISVCLQHLQTLQHSHEVCAVATAQEETGLLGARTAAWRVQPDLAIALDVTFAVQPGVEPDFGVELGRGPGLPIGPNFHPKLVEQLRACRPPPRNPLAGRAHSRRQRHRCLGHPGCPRRHPHRVAGHPPAQHALAGRDA